MNNGSISYPDEIREEHRFGQRITSDYISTTHWLPLDLKTINIKKPTILCFGGIATTNDRDANYVAKLIQRLIPVEGDANVISLIHSHIQGEKAARYFGEDKDELLDIGIREAYEIVDSIFLPLLTDENGNRLMIQDACKNIRSINIFAHCYGHFTSVYYIEVALRHTLKYFSYTDDEIERIIKQILVVSYEAGEFYKTSFPNVNITSLASELWEDIVLKFPKRDFETVEMQGDEKEKFMQSKMFETKDPELVRRFLRNNKYALLRDGNIIDIYTNGLTTDGSDHDLSTIYQHQNGSMSYYTNELGRVVSNTIAEVLRYALKNSHKNRESNNLQPLDMNEIFNICARNMQISRTYFGEVADLDFE